MGQHNSGMVSQIEIIQEVSRFPYILSLATDRLSLEKWIFHWKQTNSTMKLRG